MTGSAAVKSARHPIRWVVWHPHQKLWNWRLVGLVRRGLSFQPTLAKGAVEVLVFVDSLLLVVRVGVRRTAAVATGALGRATADARVLHVDCGVHRDGQELTWMHKWFGQRYELKMIGFEAGRSQFEQASRKLQTIPDLDLRHAALVGPDHSASTAELHFGASEAGASLFSERGQRVEVVPAVRLSEVLTSISPEPDAVIVRMNIEGAEAFVIEDILTSGLGARVDGYYGMWDDLAKLDPAADGEFRRRLSAERISNISFNGRDLAYPIRRFAIRTDLETSIRRALGRRRRA